MNNESRIVNSGDKITSFTKLNAWKYAHQLVLEIYRLTKLFPTDERFGFVDQLRRAAVSIVSNIAEGFSRQSYKEKIQFYTMAKGSVTEIQSQLLIVRNLGYISKEQFIKIAEQPILVDKLLVGLIKSSKTKI